MRRAVTLFVLGMLALVGIAAGIYAPGGDASPGKANATVKITVKASEFKFALSRRAVPVGSTVVFTVINTGKITLGPLPIAVGQPGIIPPLSPTGCI